MKQFAIARYRVVPSSDGKYVSLECEAKRGERFAFNFLPLAARTIGVNLLDAAVAAEVNEKGGKDGR